ncbi:hypothetical protein PybrP1_001791 [[Pythium] brassicae (nom. inval.)]|nr:hypothetical protein PybrP1_001791 [[Pythium] brassicae (nom. inval.)]
MGDRQPAAATGSTKRARAGRMESATPSKKNRRRRLSAGITREDEDDTVVWKDSPAAKQIRVSGTGRLAVRREVQGFVGRLARASVEAGDADAAASAPPDRDHLLPHAFAKRKASRAAADATARAASAASSRFFFASSAAVVSRVGGDSGINRGASSAETAISRQIVFSPESALRRKTVGTPPRHSPAPLAPHLDGVSGSDERAESHAPTPASSASAAAAAPKSDSQDELFMILDKIDEKYSSQDGALSATPTRTAALGSGAASAPPARVPANAHVSLQYATPEKPSALPTAGSAATVVQESPECGSPLTEESWELLDQLEYEATQRIPESQDLSSADASSQPRVCDDFRRFLVLEVDCDVYNRRLVLRLLDDRDAHVEAELADDWFDTAVEPGDTVNIVFTERDRAGFFAQDAARPPAGSPELIRVDNDRNIVILHPDVLVSPTSVTTSMGCLRRAVLCETLNVSGPTHPKALLGTLKHELFETALVQGEHSVEFLLHEARRIVQNNIIGLVECGLSEQTALAELAQVIEHYKTWLVGAASAGGVVLNEPPPGTGATVRVHTVLATEEMMWSVKWGLKGATDASVEATFSSSQLERDGQRQETVVLPVELKTGNKTYTATEHHGQVVLYTLLLNERYRQPSQHGLLLYVPGIETNKVPALAARVRSLLILRNKFAGSMAKVKALGSAAASQVFPPMLRSRSDCERCFQVNECVLHHAAVENGSPESSGLGDVFVAKLGHLGDADLAYFKRWTRMIELEQQHAEKNLRALWLQVGWRREQDAGGTSTCVASLQLVLDEPAVSASGSARRLRFQRDPVRTAQLATQQAPSPPPLRSFLELGFRADDRIVLSAESRDGTRLLVHVARGRVLALDERSITLEVRQAIPSIVTKGASTVGDDFTWRLDKDAILTGLNRAKENLVRLFVGPPPELVALGTHRDARPELAALLSSGASAHGSDNDSRPPNTGDARRRQLIVHATRPLFKTCRVSELVAQRCRSMAQAVDAEETARLGQRLLDEFARLNVDQQRAVHKVLSALDYALVLGMPGTGKTSTIAFAVRLLLFLGLSVLVTSYTHSAVDNLLLKVLEHEPQLPLLRLGAPSQVHPELAEFTLERQASSRRVTSVRAMEALLLGAQLVGCTCLSVNSHVLFQKRRFDFCIVDEATQTTQPVVLGALRCADTFVLVGDHYQLPPLVASAPARREGMDVSLFRRLSEAHPSAVQQLSFQYRMNADIMRVANRLVYGGKLKCGLSRVALNHLRLALQQHSAATSKQPPWPITVLSNGQGVVFLDTDALDGACESVGADAGGVGNGSGAGRRRMANAVEAQLVAGLVQLLVRGGVAPDEVAVISPFRAQVALITSRLDSDVIRAGGDPSRSRLSHVEVSTVDKYQGKDKDVVLVSFVRSNAENHVGELLTDWRRINVALTRARQKLVLVGSLRTLSGGSPLFSVLARTITECRWRVALAPDALETLERSVRDASTNNTSSSTRAPEPEPEREHDADAADDGYAEVSVLHPGDDNDDIEGLP